MAVDGNDSVYDDFSVEKKKIISYLMACFASITKEKKNIK